MKTVGIKIVGKKSFLSKKGNNLTICYFVSEPFEKEVEGSQAGYFFASDDFASVCEVGENYTAVLGYDRSGKFGVVDIVS